MRRILQLEQAVKDAYETDKSSDAMYQSIADLAKAILVVKGMAFNSTEVEEIGHSLATDFYMRINAGTLTVRNWTKYIMMRLYDYRSKYLRENKYHNVEIDDITDQDYLRRLMSQSLGSTDLMSSIETEDMIKDLPTIYLKTYNQICRYVEGSYEYNHILMSLLSSYLNDDDSLTLVGLDNSYREYIRFLLIFTNRALVNYINKNCSDRLSGRESISDLIHDFKSIQDE